MAQKVVVAWACGISVENGKRAPDDPDAGYRRAASVEVRQPQHARADARSVVDKHCMVSRSLVTIASRKPKSAASLRRLRALRAVLFERLPKYALRYRQLLRDVCPGDALVGNVKPAEKRRLGLPQENHKKKNNPALEAFESHDF